MRDAVHLLRDRARAPYAFLREARRCLREYGASIHDGYGISRFRQSAELAWCRACYGLDPIAYYRYQLYREDRKPKSGKFVQTHDVGRVLTWLIQTNPDDPGVLGDKRLFERWCAQHGLPTVTTLVEFARGRITARSEASLPRVDLFSKPSNWQGGRGAERWTFDGHDRWSSSSGLCCTEPALLDHLARVSTELDRPILLQRRMTNHSSIRSLVKDTLCTARVVTTRRPGTHPELVLAVYRMPAASSVADNFDLGGVAAPIDLESGRLGPAVRKYPRVSGPIVTHPDTGVSIEGIQLPFWPETTGLVLRAHDAITWSGVPVVGWDIALTENGAVLLEGNNLPCSTLAQMPGGIALGATSVVPSVNAHLRERFDGRSGSNWRASGRTAGAALAAQR